MLCVRHCGQVLARIVETHRLAAPFRYSPPLPSGRVERVRVIVFEAAWWFSSQGVWLRENRAVKPSSPRSGRSGAREGQTSQGIGMLGTVLNRMLSLWWKALCR